MLEDFKKDFNKSFMGRNWKFILMWIILNLVAIFVTAFIMNYYCFYNVISK